MRTRKTINIAEVREAGNHFLNHSDPNQTGQREGVASFLETMLSRTGNYHGFRYLEADHSVDPPTFGDETRRYYF